MSYASRDATLCRCTWSEVQRVYRNTGVYINDKRIEVIIRQMLRRVKVDEPGETEIMSVILPRRRCLCGTRPPDLASSCASAHPLWD
jgi:hypothetical protein